jgi:pimeloyl-ACP methyl ester carboxylesterase
MTTAYDEFSMFRDNAEEVGLPYDGPPTVRRVGVPLPDGRTLSALVWGAPEGESSDAEIVLLHGGAQNAHTWDTVALALGRPLVAIDLPGHGHSDWREDHRYSPRSNADDVAVAIEQLAPAARLVVGMSLGGMTSICLASGHPKLVEKLAIVDVTPGTDHAKAEPIIAFIDGPERFENFDEILQRTIQFNPTRTESSLRRGVLHNAAEQADGSWSWRYDRFRPESLNDDGADRPVDFGNMWEDVSAITAPILLLRGGLSGVVGDEDVEEFKRRQPTAQVVVVDGAGHSIQGDKPLELAALLETFLG